MAVVQVEGIIVKEVMYQESSKILTLFTKEYGMIGVLARGCRSPKSKLRGVSMRLTYGIFYLSYKNNGLSTLTQVDVLNPFSHMLMDIEKISYATYLLELTEQVAKESSDPALFELFKNTLLKIEEGLDPEVLTMILEVQYLSSLGVSLCTSCCTICGNTSHIRTISVDAGGFLCDACYRGEKLYSEKFLQLIRMFSLVDIAKISKLSIQDAMKKELRDFLEYYYEKYTGLYLKSRNFLKNLKKIGS